MDTRIPCQLAQGGLQVVATHRVANVDVQDQEEHRETTICIFTQKCVLCLHTSSRLDQRPFKGLGSRGPASRRAEKETL